MPGRHKQPVALLVAKGRSHMSKDDIERRAAEELQVPFTDVRPPDYLTNPRNVEEFDDIAGKLKALGIFTELDVDTLARYILAKNLYLMYTARLSKLIPEGDADSIAKFQRLQAEAFKQCRACSSDLGLTITSRCKIVIPQVDDAEDYEL